MHEYLDQLLLQHGCHQEDLLNVQMEGSEGMSLMQRLMKSFRESPPTEIGGLAVAAVRDYKSLTITPVGGGPAKLEAPPADMVILDLAEPGNYVAVRPSGTEPKVKFYFFSCLSPADSKDLVAAKARLRDRLAAYRSDIQAYAKKVTAH
jgi:phosphoglucomutase/phosphomannomutase